MLLVVAVVAGIALVALRSARASASETRQLADLRSGAALFASWSHDRSEEFLNLQRDPQRYAMRCEPWRGSHYCVHWESQWHRWNTVYFWTTGERSPVQGFLYSFTFVSDPAMWSLNPGPERLGHAARRHFRPVRTHEVWFPAEKALLISRSSTGRHPVAFADGSAMAATQERVLTQTTAPIWMPPQSAEPMPGASTLDGVRGRDVAR